MFFSFDATVQIIGHVRVMTDEYCILHDTAFEKVPNSQLPSGSLKTSGIRVDRSATYGFLLVFHYHSQHGSAELL